MLPKNVVLASSKVSAFYVAPTVLGFTPATFYAQETQFRLSGTDFGINAGSLYELRWFYTDQVFGPLSDYDTSVSEECIVTRADYDNELECTAIFQCPGAPVRLVIRYNATWFSTGIEVTPDQPVLSCVPCDCARSIRASAFGC